MTKSVFTNCYVCFRQMLIQERQSKGVTQTQLAQRLNKPQSYVSKYENGERRLDVIEFLGIADCIGMDPVEFIRRLKDNE